jgi:hypothetical protein
VTTADESINQKIWDLGLEQREKIGAVCPDFIVGLTMELALHSPVGYADIEGDDVTAFLGTLAHRGLIWLFYPNELVIPENDDHLGIAGTVRALARGRGELAFGWRDHDVIWDEDNDIEKGLGTAFYVPCVPNFTPVTFSDDDWKTLHDRI